MGSLLTIIIITFTYLDSTLSCGIDLAWSNFGENWIKGAWFGVGKEVCWGWGGGGGVRVVRRGGGLEVRGWGVGVIVV